MDKCERLMSELRSACVKEQTVRSFHVIYAQEVVADLVDAACRIAALEAKLAEASLAMRTVYEWMNQLPIPTTGCTSKMQLLYNALSALEATPPAPKVTEWREITEDDQPPRDVPVLMGCWEKWPRDEWVIEFGLYGSTKGGWIHGRMTHWLPASILPIAPALSAAQESGQ